MSITEIRQWLRYEFTQDDLRAKAQELAQAVKDKEDAEHELETVRTQLKSRVTTADGVIALCSKNLREGYEMRNILCTQEIDLKKSIITITRKDTGEEVSRRNPTEEEKQYQLNLEKPEPAAS